MEVVPLGLWQHGGPGDSGDTRLCSGTEVDQGVRAINVSNTVCEIGAARWEFKYGH